jgi:hypothetical protein
LGNVGIAAAIETAQTRLAAEVHVSAQEAMRLNADLLRFDPAVLFDEAGNARPLQDIPVEARRWIKRVRVHKQNLTAGDGKIDKVLDYEIYDKSAALERDYKRWGLSKERLEHDGDIVIKWQD